ncbi:MAG TPA: hypothetical protein VIP11_05225 [Gemmatimonadaceae bacterium]
MANRDKENDKLTDSGSGRRPDSGTSHPGSPERNRSDFDKGVSRDRGGMSGSPGSTDQGDGSQGDNKSGKNRDSGINRGSDYGSSSNR